MRAGVVEVDVQDGGGGGDGVELVALAVGPGGVRQDLLGNTALVRLLGGQALACCGELLLPLVDSQVTEVTQAAGQGHSRGPDEAAARDRVAVCAALLGLAQLLGLEACGLAALGLGLAGLFSGHAVLLVVRWQADDVGE